MVLTVLFVDHFRSTEWPAGGDVCGGTFECEDQNI